MNSGSYALAGNTSLLLCCTSEDDAYTKNKIVSVEIICILRSVVYINSRIFLLILTSGVRVTSAITVVGFWFTNRNTIL